MQDEFRGLSPQPLWDPGSASQLAGAPQWAATEGKMLLQGGSTTRVLAPVWPCALTSLWESWSPCPRGLSCSFFLCFLLIFFSLFNLCQQFFPLLFSLPPVSYPLFLLFLTVGFICLLPHLLTLRSFSLPPSPASLFSLPPPSSPLLSFLFVSLFSLLLSSRFHFLCVSSDLLFLLLSFLFLPCVPLFLCFLLFLSLSKLGSKWPGVCQTGWLSLCLIITSKHLHDLISQELCDENIFEEIKTQKS